MNLNNVEPVSHQGNTNSWYTPKWILDKCGDFDLDPCGDSHWPTAKTIYETNGLEQEWFGRVWLNPPYGRNVGKWLDKMSKHGNGLVLIFARTDTKWFQKFAPSCSWFLFLSGRVKFVDSETLTEAKQNPGAPSVLIGVGDQNIPKLDGFALASGRKIRDGDK